MNRIILRNNSGIPIFASILFVILTVCSVQVMAGDLTPEVEAKIKAYKQKLTQWSNDADIIKAVEEMNARVVKMNNKTWKDLAQDDPEVMKYQKTSAGKKLTDWQKDKSLGKLFLRDHKGNLAAGSKKPAVYNIAERRPFLEAMAGKTWNSNMVKPDPTTKLSSIQISAPVISNGKKIGVIHTSLIVE